MTKYFYIDTIVKRAMSPVNVKRRYKDPMDMHQDYFCMILKILVLVVRAGFW